MNDNFPYYLLITFIAAIALLVLSTVEIFIIMLSDNSMSPFVMGYILGFLTPILIFIWAMSGSSTTQDSTFNTSVSELGNFSPFRIFR